MAQILANLRHFNWCAVQDSNLNVIKNIASQLIKNNDKWFLYSSLICACDVLFPKKCVLLVCTYRALQVDYFTENGIQIFRCLLRIVSQNMRVCAVGVHILAMPDKLL